MDAHRLSAFLLIGAFGAIMLSSFVNAPGLYQTQDIEERLQIIETYRTRWLTERVLVVVGVLLLIVGFSLLAYTLRTSWIPILGAVVMIAGTLVGLYFVYLQTVDPRGGYSGAYPTAENLAYWLWLGGTLLYGVAFLQAELARLSDRRRRRPLRHSIPVHGLRLHGPVHRRHSQLGNWHRAAQDVNPRDSASWRNI